MYFAGYSKPYTFEKLALAGQSFRVGDERLVLTQLQHVARAKVAQMDAEEARAKNKKFDTGVHGCRGTCVFVEKLTYVKYSSFFILPTYR